MATSDLNQHSQERPSSSQTGVITSVQEDEQIRNAASNIRTRSKIIKPVSKYLTTDRVVTLYVGADRKRYILNEDLLCDRIPFFAAAFRSNFKEAHEKTMDVPDDDSGAFGILIDYIYGGNIDCKKPNNAGILECCLPPGLQHDLLWCNVYILGDKYELPYLCQRALEMFEYCCFDVDLPPFELGQVADFVYDNTSEDSPLRRLVIDQLVIIYFWDIKVDYQKTFLEIVIGRNELQLDCFKEITAHLMLDDCHPDRYCSHHRRQVEAYARGCSPPYS